MSLFFLINFLYFFNFVNRFTLDRNHILSCFAFLNVSFVPNRSLELLVAVLALSPQLPLFKWSFFYFCFLYGSSLIFVAMLVLNVRYKSILSCCLIIAEEAAQCYRVDTLAMNVTLCRG